MTNLVSPPDIYQGQFGTFTITERDRREVIFYRAGLGLAGLTFAIGSGLILWQGTNLDILSALTLLFALFSLGLGISLALIHIYLVLLHRVLQAFWVIGTLSSVILAIYSPEPFALFVYQHPLSLFGVGFTFAALTGIYFKEAFCFNRFETKLLTPLVPLLLLGHLFSILPASVEQGLLAVWAILFLIFIGRKATQEIPPDIGDKSVFTYLKQQKVSNP
ncbi:MAG: DUF2301 domain-containing membrane protein [Snowella sp.]|nr:DUF2301 domain-containing membrane protein [Snowella sp.]